MFKSSENNKKQNEKGDEDVDTTIDINSETEEEKQIQISKKAVENLKQGKTVIKSKDGVVQINKNHPDYNFWMED